jgi:hypothetical protein
VSAITDIQCIRFRGRISDNEEVWTMDAAVIDLQAFRERRQAEQCQMMRPAPVRPWIPVWVWVMVWPA